MQQVDDADRLATGPLARISPGFVSARVDSEGVKQTRQLAIVMHASAADGHACARFRIWSFYLFYAPV